MQGAADAATLKFLMGFMGFFGGGGLLIVPALLAALFRVFGRKLQAVVIDGLIFCLVWLAAVAAAGASPPMAFMSQYRVDDFIVYLKVMTVMSFVLYLLSIFMYRSFGGSVGKIISGYKTVHLDGSPLDARSAFLRSTILFVLGLLILAPGPIIGYLFGDGSAPYSVFVLIFALGIWWFIAVLVPAGGNNSNDLVEFNQTRLEKWLGLTTVPRKGT